MDSDRMDLGQVRIGESHEYSFTVDKLGSDPKIFSVQWESRNSPWHSQPTYSPNDKATFPKTVHFTVITHGSIHAGEYLDNLLVVMDSITTPIPVHVQILPELPLDIEVSPARLDLSPIQVGSKNKISFTITPTGREISVIHLNWQNEIPRWASKLEAAANAPHNSPISVIFIVEPIESGNFSANIGIEIFDAQNRNKRILVPVTFNATPRPRLFGLF